MYVTVVIVTVVIVTVDIVLVIVIVIVAILVTIVSQRLVSWPVSEPQSVVLLFTCQLIRAQHACSQSPHFVVLTIVSGQGIYYT